MTRQLFDLLGARTALTLAQARALADDPPSWMRDSQKRRLAHWVLVYEKAERAKQTRRYGEVLAQVKETRDRIEQRVEAAHREVAEIQTAVRHGRLAEEEANKRLSVVFRTINEQRALTDSLDQSQARASEMVDMDPSDYQQSVRDRFASVADAIPALTLAYLDGDEADPFGGAS